MAKSLTGTKILYMPKMYYLTFSHQLVCTLFFTNIPDHSV